MGTKVRFRQDTDTSKYKTNLLLSIFEIQPISTISGDETVN